MKAAAMNAPEDPSDPGDALGEIDTKLIFEIVSRHLPHHSAAEILHVLQEVLGLAPIAGAEVCSSNEEA